MKHQNTRWGLRIELENGEYIFLAWKAWLLAFAIAAIAAGVLKYTNIWK